MDYLKLETKLCENDRMILDNLMSKLDLLISNKNEDVWLTISEVARRLKFSERTISRWVKDDLIPYRRYQGSIRFLPSEVDSWFDEFKPNNIQAARELTKEYNQKRVAA